MPRPVKRPTRRKLGIGWHTNGSKVESERKRAKSGILTDILGVDVCVVCLVVSKSMVCLIVNVIGVIGIGSEDLDIVDNKQLSLHFVTILIQDTL